WRDREDQMILVPERREPARTLLEFVARAEMPAFLYLRGLTQRHHLQTAHVLVADHHREAVIDAERIQQLDVQLAILAAHAIQNRRRIRRNRLLEDRGERGACVFRVYVDIAAEQRLVSQQRPAEIETPRDVHMPPLQMLR